MKNQIKIKNILLEVRNNHYGIASYKEYQVEYKGKSDTISYSDEDSIVFEPYNGSFNEEEFAEVRKALFDDAYYNRNFSIYK
jgi:hypothetical protein